MTLAACISDIPGIISVQDSVLMRNVSYEAALKNGFLMYRIEPDDLEKVMSDSGNVVICYKTEAGVLGYILGYDLSNWRKLKFGWLEKIEVSEEVKSTIRNNRVAYLRHIARRIGHDGVGSKMLTEFIRICKGRGFSHIVCEILEHEPKNKVSLNFFVKEFGFVRIGQVDYGDGLIWGVYLFRL
jgi:predicted GNAT superfamily acetyltransferase